MHKLPRFIEINYFVEKQSVIKKFPSGKGQRLHGLASGYPAIERITSTDLSTSLYTPPQTSLRPDFKPNFNQRSR